MTGLTEEESKVEGGKRDIGGTGPGPFISLELTKLPDGCLTLRSEERKGKDFTLYLPVSR